MKDKILALPQWALGVDVGGTKILGAAVDVANGKVERVVKLPTPQTSEAIVSQIFEVLNLLICECAGVSFKSVGVGLPGLVDNGGVLRYGPNLPGVRHLDLPKLLADEFAIPVAVENDGACAALAEHRFGAAQGFADALVLTLGTGIGGGIISAGRLLRGANGFAAEPGHMVADPAGPVCACGRRGCWESLASGSGLVNLARGLQAEGRGGVLVSSGRTASDLRGEDISAACAAGDPDAVELFERFALWVASGIADLVNLLDPAVVVVGGGLSSVSGFFLERVESEISSLIMGGGFRPKVSVIAAELGAKAGVIGSALHAADVKA